MVGRWGLEKQVSRVTQCDLDKGCGENCRGENTTASMRLRFENETAHDSKQMFSDAIGLSDYVIADLEVFRVCSV
jgi:hypothetical protein